MNFRKYFDLKLNDLFEDEMSKYLSDEDMIDYKKIINTTYNIKVFPKTSINESNAEIYKNNSKNKIKREMGLAGKSIITLYKNNIQIGIDGRWDNASNNLLETKNGYFFPVYKNGLGGFIDEKLKIKVFVQYTNINEAIENKISDKFLWLQKDNEEYGYGLVSIAGRKLTEFIHTKSDFDIFKLSYKEYLKLRTENGVNIYNISEKKYMFDTFYNDITILENNDSLIVQNNDLSFSLVSLDNTISKKYDIITEMTKDRFLATKDKHIGIIDSNDNTILDFNFDRILFFNENILSLKNKKTNLIEIYNYNGKLIGDPNEK